jgi:hypothetical protein
MRRLLFGGGHTGSLASIEILSRSGRFAFGATEKNWIHEPTMAAALPSGTRHHREVSPGSIISGEIGLPPVEREQA